MATFDSLPYEIKFVILSQTGMRDLANFCSTNRSYYELGNREEYYQLVQNRVNDLVDRYEIVGTIDSHDKFRICFPHDRAITTGPRSGRRIIRGRVAETIDKHNLLEYCWKLYIPLTDTFLPDVTEDQIDYIRYRYILDTENFTKSKLIYFYYGLRLSSIKRLDLSDALKQCLISLNRITYI